MTNLNENIKDILINISGREIKTCEINDNTNIISDLGFDSVKIIQLIVEIENKFNIEIEDEDMDINNLNNCKSLRELIAKKISN